MAFKSTLMASATLWQTLQHSDRLYNSLTDSATLWQTLQHYDRLCNTLTDSTTLWQTLQHSDRLYNTMTDSTTLWQTLQHSDRLYNTLSQPLQALGQPPQAFSSLQKNYSNLKRQLRNRSLSKHFEGRTLKAYKITLVDSLQCSPCLYSTFTDSPCNIVAFKTLWPPFQHNRWTLSHCRKTII